MAFYIQPPGGNISLQKLTTYAETRLRFLCQVYLTNGDGMKLQDIVLATEAIEESECLIEGTIKDKISHFILRLAFSESKDMRSFLLTAETSLFNFRFSCMTKDELIKCLRSLDKHIRNLTLCSNHHIRKSLGILMTLKDEFHGWKRLVHKYLNGDSNDFMEVPFQTVLQLVAKREVLLNRGIASVPVCRLRELVTSLFSQILAAGLQDAGQTKQSSNGDVRMCKLYRTLRSMLCEKLGRNIHPVSVTWSLTHADVDSHVQLFPPCMGQLHRSLRQQHRLSHHARILYTLFLKEAGLPVHEALMFWMKEYSQSPSNNNGCCHNWTENENRYTYNIRHLYGLEGSRINYRGHSCKALQELHVGPTCEGGCPFSHFDSSHLYNMLKTEDIEERHSEILDLSSQGKYTDACELYLSEKLKPLRCNSKGVDKNATVLESSECDGDECVKSQKEFTSNDITNCPDFIVHLSNTFCGSEGSDKTTEKYNNQLSNVKDNASHESDSSECEENVKRDSEDNTKGLVSSSQSETNSWSEQVSLTSGTSFTLSKSTFMTDSKPKGFSEFLDKPECIKVRKKDCDSVPCVSRQTSDKRWLTISKPVEYYLHLKNN